METSLHFKIAGNRLNANDGLRRFDMWIMRFLLKILVLPLLLAVDAATLITKASIYVGCYVVGFAVWLCGIFCILSIIFKMIPCAIFFAAPCVPLVFGCISQCNFGRLPVMATIMGIIGGLIIWPLIPFGQQASQLAGVGASLLISLLIMLIG